MHDLSDMDQGIQAILGNGKAADRTLEAKLGQHEAALPGDAALCLDRAGDSAGAKRLQTKSQAAHERAVVAQFSGEPFRLPPGDIKAPQGPAIAQKAEASILKQAGMHRRRHLRHRELVLRSLDGRTQQDL